MDTNLAIRDLGRVAYAECMAIQRRVHAGVLAGDTPATLLLVEHEPVITVSRRPGAREHLLATAAQLDAAGIGVELTDRGGDITYHGPGQLVAYPIVSLGELRMNVARYMRTLEQAVIDTLCGYGVAACRDRCATGVWVGGGEKPAKVCALGIRVKRNVTLHGVALNVDPDMEHFKTIVPCGLAGRGVTSLRRLLGGRTPGMARVKADLAGALNHHLCLCASLTTPAYTT